MKSFLVRTPLYRPLLELRAAQEYRNVMSTPVGTFKTAYCVSPFKTGTTYLAEHFGNFQKAVHEPMMYTTLKHLDDVEFLARRATYLNVPLESSGFFAGRLSLLRQFAPDAPVVSIYRPYAAWIGSVLNYFEQLNDKLTYNYIARLVFDPICGHPIDQFSTLPVADRNAVIRSLFDFWAAAYQDALNDPGTMVIPLTQVDESLDQIAAFLELKNGRLANPAWKRKNADKRKYDLSVITQDAGRCAVSVALEAEVTRRLADSVDR